jgi:hypothetical protein
MAGYDGLLFDSVDLNGLTNIEIDNVGIEAPPEFLLASAKLARTDGLKLFNKEYGGRVIPVRGRIMASGRSGFLATRDILMRYLAPLEATLRVPNGDDPIDFTATVENVMFSDTGGGYGAFTINFLCSDPFGYDAGHRTIINGSLVTAASADIGLLETIGGSVSAPMIITLTIANVTGGTGKYIDVANQGGDSIRITRDWSVGEVIVIDMRQKICQVNGVAVDYTGTFWNLAVGDTEVTYSDNLTTRSVSIMATYKRRRL